MANRIANDVRRVVIIRMHAVLVFIVAKVIKDRGCMSYCDRFAGSVRRTAIATVHSLQVGKKHETVDIQGFLAAVGGTGIGQGYKG